MEKRKSHAFGKDIYLLGADKNGKLYWLEAGSWDCDWYWGFGYVETYTNNRNPARARDISSHQHFDGLFFNKGKLSYDVFKEFFVDMTVSDKELWKLLELMKSYYMAKEYAFMLHMGGAHITANPCKDVIQNMGEWLRINREVIPAIMNAVYGVLSSEEVKDDEF